MSAGLGVLKLAPTAFWAMTPRELAAALGPLWGAYGSPVALNRDELSALMQRFPDRKDHDHG